MIRSTLFASALCLSAGAACAATIDFNSLSDTITGNDLGGVSLSAGGTPVQILGGGPNGTNGVLAYETFDFFATLRADFLVGPINFVSVDLGDFGQDADALFLEVYDTFDSLIDEASLLIPATFTGMKTLSVRGSGIAYALFGGAGVNGSSVYADNLTFKDVAAIPLPAGGLLLAGGLGLLGLARRRRN